MRSIRSRAFVFVVTLFAGALLFSSLAWADGPYYAGRGLYVTAAGTYNNLTGGSDNTLSDSIDENVFTVKAGVSYTFELGGKKKQEF